MRYPPRFLAPLFTLCLLAGCGSSDDVAIDETTAAPTTTTAAPTTTTAAPTTTTAAPTTTTAAPTTTTAAPTEAPEVDEALIPRFAAKVRDKWEDTERLVGGTAPDHSDDEIAAIARSICEYFGAHPLPVHSNATTPERMEAYSNAAVIIAEGLGVPYDPALQDAGFEDGIDARNVTAFKYTLEPGGDGGLCPVPTSGPGSMPCAVAGCRLFGSPWSAAASAK